MSNMNSGIDQIFSKIHNRLVLYRHVFPFVKRNKDRVITRENTICLFCHPRGGSTWLAELLLHLPGSTLIDEPLWRGNITEPFGMPDAHARKVPAISELGFFYYQYIPESATWPEARQTFSEILAGRVPSSGLYEEQGWHRLRYNNLHIVKFCYGNMLMPWLMKQFDVRAILLTRHPCAVVGSQLQHPSWRDIRIHDHLKVADFPYNEPYRLALEKIGKITSRETYLACIWALNFKHTAMHPDNNRRWLTVSYERLLTNYEAEIQRISRYVGVDLSTMEINYQKPSRSGSQNSGSPIDPEIRLMSWKTTLNEDQIMEILRVLEVFEIDIYGRHPEPDYDRLYSKNFRP